ncbi:uncharacterized protein DUF3995 [Algoriphagus chordae]|uniref:Uncharacterized protein DUF3995 n=2 Tax=Algoriphagus chordae TaxID=237019 RepID=A0A2W7RK56_9BACT|nr:uncharacterized protein DUF3995 [Algoriphagus chordae]
MILSVLLSLILIVLALIHFNWVFGGEFGFKESLPTDERGERVLNPKRLDSAIVGLGLTAFGMFYVFKTGLFAFHLPEWILNYVGWIIPVIFLLRAIGEFRYIGFFKRVKNTEFAQLDRKLFSPLCLLIGLLGVLAQLFK